jgi:hypothetical protein
MNARGALIQKKNSTSAVIANLLDQIDALKAKANKNRLRSKRAEERPRTKVTCIFMWGMWDTKPFPFEDKLRCLEGFGYDARVYGREMVERLVEQFTNEHSPNLSKAYYSIQRKVSQADIGRYLLVFYFGGMYLDNDVTLQRPLTDREWVDKGAWFIEKYLCDTELGGLGPREERINLRMANYALGYPKPKCAALKAIINEAVRRVLSMAGGYIWTDEDVLYCTGPDVVTTMYDKWGEQLFSSALESGIVTHAAHGTWRDFRDVTPSTTSKANAADEASAAGFISPGAASVSVGDETDETTCIQCFATLDTDSTAPVSKDRGSPLCTACVAMAPGHTGQVERPSANAANGASASSGGSSGGDSGGDVGGTMTREEAREAWAVWERQFDYCNRHNVTKCNCFEGIGSVM